MLINLVFLSYAVAATAFLLFSVLLMTKWRGRLHWVSLLVASALTTVWAANIAWHGYVDTPFSFLTHCLEVVRGAGWIGGAIVSLPSVKTLVQITTWPKEARAVLESRGAVTRALLESDKPFPNSSWGNFEHTHNWVRSCYNQPPRHDIRMAMADELCETCGVEYTPAGHNAKSPAIEYLNAGDTYAATLLYVNGSYRVGCWGDIVERGKYD